MARQVGSIGQDENAELIDEKKSDNLPSAREETVRREEKPPSRPASAVGRASSQVSKSGGANAQASPRTGVPETPRRAVEKKEGSTVDHQAWKVKDSDSDISTLSHKQTKNSKN